MPRGHASLPSEPASRFDATFPDTGVLVGGDALPHRLVIFVEDEEHGRLPDWLMAAWASPRYWESI